MKAEIIIRGGRDPVGFITDGPITRGLDIGVFVVIDGKRTLLPVRSLVLRCEGRCSVATVELEVREIELTGIEVAGITRV